jgi:thiosulfate/3-mercaptopyruvate sulfurtransferase
MTEQYVHSDKLVTTDWLAENLNNSQIRIVESNEDPLLYRSGHIPGAVEIDWTNDLNDPVRRDYLDKDSFEKLLSSKGIDNNTIVVLYGDKSNWWATYALWVFELFGYNNTKILDGGRLKWLEEGRPLVKEFPSYESSYYTAKIRDDSSIRAFRDQVLEHSNKKLPLIDVRSPPEFSGEKLHMPEYPNEGALRGGHIPGAKNVPWATAANPDGTFKSYAELKNLYINNLGLNKDNDVITYCRIGERSSHSWFVLKYLLGFNNVRNYDGSWTEYGNLVGVPIER